MKPITIRRMSLVLGTVWVIALSAFSFAGAAPQLPFPKSGDVVLEIAVRAGLPERFIVSSSVQWMEFLKLSRLSNWRRPSNQTLEAEGIHLDYYRRGNTVVMDVDVFLGPINLSTCPPVPRDRIKSGGSYSIKIGESATLDGLAQYGIEPFNVKILATEWRTLNSSEITNNTKAIEVVRVDQFIEWFRIVLKNISSKNIAYGSISYTRDSQSFAALAVGETREISLFPSATRSYRVDSSGRAVIEPVTSHVSVTSVVFEDLTFEGDRQSALVYFAQRRGAQFQATRIIGLLQSALDSHEQDSTKVLANLRQQLSALSNVSSRHLVDEFVERVGPVAKLQRNELEIALYVGMNNTIRDFLNRMQTYEKKEAPKGTSAESWLRTAKSAYEEASKEALAEKGKATR
jgi:hypothetical protein